MAADKKMDLLFEILASEQAILQRTDQKAFTLLSLLGVFSTFFIVHYTKIPADVYNLSLIFLYFVAILLSIFFLVMVIAPRIKDVEGELFDEKKTVTPTFFGGIIRYKSSREYAKTLEQLWENPDATYELFAQSVYSVGRINAYKNKFFKKGIISFVVAISIELIIIVSLYFRMVA